METLVFSLRDCVRQSLDFPEPMRLIRATACCLILPAPSAPGAGDQSLKLWNSVVQIHEVPPHHIESFFYHHDNTIGYMEPHVEMTRGCLIKFPGSAFEAVWQSAEAASILTLTISRSSPSRGPYQWDILRAELAGEIVSFADLVDVYSQRIGRPVSPEDVIKVRNEFNKPR